MIASKSWASSAAPASLPIRNLVETSMAEAGHFGLPSPQPPRGRWWREHMTNAIRILGLDPGLRRTGWGVVAVEGARLSHIAHGVIAPDDSLPLAERLLALFEGVAAIIVLHAPHEAAVEETFMTANGASTLKLGHARAAVMIAPGRAARRRVRRQGGQEGGCRHRRRRQGPGRVHDRPPAPDRRRAHR